MSLYTAHILSAPCARCSRAASEQNWASSMIHSQDMLLYLVYFIFSSPNIELTCLVKKLQVVLICPKDIFSETSWSFFIMFCGKFYSFFSDFLVSWLIVSHFGSNCGHMAWLWYFLTLQFSYNVFIGGLEVKSWHLEFWSFLCERIYHSSKYFY